MFIVTMAGTLINLLRVRSIYITNSPTGNTSVYAELSNTDGITIFIGTSENCDKYISKLYGKLEQKDMTITF